MQPGRAGSRGSTRRCGKWRCEGRPVRGGLVASCSPRCRQEKPLIATRLSAGWLRGDLSRNSPSPGNTGDMMRLASLFLAFLLVGCGGSGPDKTTAGGKVGRAAASTPDEPKPSKGDGSFGLDLKDGPSRLQISKDGANPEKGFYLLTAVPSPSPQFSTYAVIAFDKVGICEIRAFSDEIAGDSLGAQTRGVVDRLADALSLKYGKGRALDYCAGGDVACEQQFWAMSLSNGERAYAHLWETTKPPIRSIAVSATADNLSRLSVRLDYEIGDAKACAAAVTSAQGANL